MDNFNMAKDLQRLGIKRGDTLLMHSSLKSLGIEGFTPGDVIAVLQNILTHEGTLILPALSYRYCNKNNREFEYYKTPSNVGVIPEYFRTQVDGVVRSMSPTHSCCAWGKNADLITASHHLDNTPCGENSPFNKVREIGGKILFLGCGMRPNTSMHAVEELIRPDYLFEDEYEFKMTDKDGLSYYQRYFVHNFKNTVQRYDRLEGLLDATALKVGLVAKATCHLVDVRKMWLCALEAYKSDEHYFVDITG